MADGSKADRISFRAPQSLRSDLKAVVDLLGDPWNESRAAQRIIEIFLDDGPEKAKDMILSRPDVSLRSAYSDAVDASKEQLAEVLALVKKLQILVQDRIATEHQSDPSESEHTRTRRVK